MPLPKKMRDFVMFIPSSVCCFWNHRRATNPVSVLVQIPALKYRNNGQKQHPRQPNSVNRPLQRRKPICCSHGTFNLNVCVVFRYAINRLSIYIIIEVLSYSSQPYTGFSDNFIGELMVSSLLQALPKATLSIAVWSVLSVYRRKWRVRLKKHYKMSSIKSSFWFSRRFIAGSLLVRWASSNHKPSALQNAKDMSNQYWSRHD